MSAPEIVQRLAASVGGIVLAWREYDDHFTIVMVDGRKLTFNKKDASQPRNTMQPSDMQEHVGTDVAAPRRAAKTRREQ